MLKFLRNHQSTITLLVVLALAAFVVYDKYSRPEEKQETIVQYVSTEGGYLTVAVPDSFAFCGEPVPLEEPDVIERFDRELHVNVFWHSNTYLMIKRANRWLPQITEVLKKNGIPEDFKYLAVIESGLLNVGSPAGAEGFWQFLEDTGKEYGLEITEDVDERHDPIKATEAACKYLKDAHRKFGNWTSVAASYNCGMAGLKKYFDDQNVPSYYDLKLNTETSRYVFRILAVKEIMESPAKYNVEIHDKHLYEVEKVKTVTVKESINDLPAYAKSLGINYKLLKRHNPWLKTDRLRIGRKSKQSYEIKVPVKE